MELLLIPVLLVTGAAMLHLSVHGTPALAHPVMDMTSSIGVKSVRLPSPIRMAPHAAPLGPRPIVTQETSLQMTDILLADLLTEMVEFREALDTLKGQVETLTAAQVIPAQVTAPRKRAQRSA
jgi:hypothetical protein